MARGLVLGATLISVFAFILCLIFTFVPLWLVLRIESDTQFCWWGEGIFHSRVWYGPDLDKVFFLCEDPEGLGPLNTYNAYCSDTPVPRLNAEDPEDYAQGMCAKTNQAKITSSLAIVTSFVTVVVGLLLHFTRLRRRYEYYLVVSATVTSSLTIALSTATLGIMFTSPLFSMAHNRALSQMHHGGIPFDGYSCSLTSPMRNPIATMLPASLYCLFPGPSFLAPLLLILAQGMATVFFMMLSKQILNASRKLPASLQATLVSSSSPFLMPTPTQQADDDDAELTDDEMMTTRHPGGRQPQQADGDDEIFRELRNIRVYSLYGASARRTSAWSKCRQWCVITLVPYVLFLAHAMCWTGFILLGLQIIGGVKVTVVYPPRGGSLTVSGDEDDGAANGIYVDMSQPEHAQILQLVMPYLQDILAQSNATVLFSSSKNGGDKVKSLLLFEDIVNAFNFSPELSIGFFWNNGAAFIAVLTFLAMFVLPIGKSLVWVWYWFAPGDEWWRGWILTFVDFSGKWMLAYVFVMAILGTAMVLQRTLVFPWFLFAGILPKHSSLLVNMSVGMTWNGLGCWLLILACVASLLLGQIILYIHQLSVDWEEQRRGTRDQQQRQSTINSNTNNRPYSLSSSTGTSTSTAAAAQANFLSPSLVNSESPFVNLDTPAIMASSRPYPAGQNSRVMQQDTRPKNMMQAIQSFSNLQELPGGNGAGDHTQHRHDEDDRKPILTAIARYGSRNALNAMGGDADEDVEDVDILVQRLTNNTALGGNRASFARQRMSRAIHPEVEAMCDRVHQPMQGVRLRWTPFGKAVIWFNLFLLSGMFILSQLVNVVEVEQNGAEMFFEPRVQTFSILTMAQKILTSGWKNRQPYQISFLIFITLSVMPMVRLLLVAYLWVLPLTIAQQRTMFSFLEFSEAWSSLEVFLVTLAVTKIEMPQFMNGMTGAMTPNITKIVLFIFPSFDGLIAARLRLLPGFWFVCCAVVLEKILSRLIMQQAVTAISERQAEKILRNLAATHSGAQGGGPLQRIDENLSTGGRRDMTGMIGDATEGLLETNAAYFFSPAGRYTIAPHTLYAGLPRRLWTGFFVRWGLLGDAEIVGSFGSPSSYSAATNTPAGLGMTTGGLGSQYQPNNLHPVDDGFILEEHTRPLNAGDYDTAGGGSRRANGGGSEESPLMF